MKTLSQIDTFTRAYIDCALWSSTDNSDDSGGEPLDSNYGSEDIAPETLQRMIEDCEQFQSGNRDDLESACTWGMMGKFTERKPSVVTSKQNPPVSL